MKMIVEINGEKINTERVRVTFKDGGIIEMDEETVTTVFNGNEENVNVIDIFDVGDYKTEFLNKK
jgi:hypothetical protein